MKVLYVDDDPDDADIFRSAVEDVDSAIRLTIAHDKTEMLKALSTECPQFIFIDHNRPLSTSAELLKSIKSTPCSEKATVVVYSNYMPEVVEQECRSLGVHDCWEKTSDYEKLCGLIRDLLKNHR